MPRSKLNLEFKKQVADILNIPYIGLFENDETQLVERNLLQSSSIPSPQYSSSITTTGVSCELPSSIHITEENNQPINSDGSSSSDESVEGVKTCAITPKLPSFREKEIGDCFQSASMRSTFEVRERELSPLSSDHCSQSSRKKYHLDFSSSLGSIAIPDSQEAVSSRCFSDCGSQILSPRSQSTTQPQSKPQFSSPLHTITNVLSESPISKVITLSGSHINDNGSQSLRPQSGDNLLLKNLLEKVIFELQGLKDDIKDIKKQTSPVTEISIYQNLVDNLPIGNKEAYRDTVIESILKILLLDEFSMMCNWSGANNKIKIKDSFIIQLITGVLHLQSISMTSKEWKAFIVAYLKKAFDAFFQKKEDL